MKQAVLVVLLCLWPLAAIAAKDAGEKETVYERVMRTGTIRCGYVSYPPYVIKNINTGAITGIWADLMDEVGNQLSLGIEWTEEVGTGDQLVALQSGRFDALCTGALSVPARARAVNFTQPFYYDPLYVVVRPEDVERFKDVTKLNSPDYTMMVLEGEAAHYIALDRFPNARIVTQPSLTDPGQRFLDIVHGKGDASLVGMSNFHIFDTHNPGALAILDAHPLTASKAGIVVAKGEFDLWKMLDTTVGFLNDTGFTKSIAEKYDNVIVPVLPPALKPAGFQPPPSAR